MAAGRGFSRQGAESSGRSWTAEGSGAGGGGAGTDAADGGAQVQLLGSPAKPGAWRDDAPPCDGTSLDELPARRIARAVAALRSWYGTDPLFCDIIDEAEILAFTMVAEDRPANRAAPTAGRNDLTPRERRLGVDTMVSAPATLEGLDQLTPRERQVARLLAQGKSDRDIATILSVTLQTAHSHSKAVLAKLGLHSRHELAHVLPTPRSG